MREAKRSRSGFSNRQNVTKSKRTYKAPKTLNNMFLGKPNRTQGIAIGILLLLIIGGIGGYYIYKSPAFHTYNYDANGNLIDPLQTIWGSNNFPNSAGEWQFLKSNYKANCDQHGGNCIQLLSNSTRPALALTKNSIQLDTVGGHELYGVFTYCFDTSPSNSGNRWGMYLTTNGTIPSGISSNNYNPKDDKSVALSIEVLDIGSGNINSYNWIQKDVQKSILSGDVSSGVQGSGTLYMAVSGTQDVTTPCNSAGNTQTTIAIFLNYTGASTATMGVNSLMVVAPVGVSGAQTTQYLQPWFNFQASSFFVGFYMLPCSGCATIDFTEQSPIISGGLIQFGRQDPVAFTPIAKPSNVEPGGFFGPIIRWFVSGAVFIWQNIINFLAYLSTILSPILTIIITVFSVIFVAVFNALGGIFGDPTLGNDIGTFFSNLTSYFANIFGLAITIIVGIAGPNGLLANAVQIAINFLSGSNNFIGVLVTLATGLAGLIPVLSGFWTLLVSLFNLGIAGADFIIIIMLVLLEFAAITDWIQDDNPIDALVAIPLAFFLFYFLANAPSSINIIALNNVNTYCPPPVPQPPDPNAIICVKSISTSYSMAWANVVWFIKLFPIMFFAIFFEWTMSLDETARFHRQTTILHNFFSIIKFYRLLTVDIVIGSWWFFDNAYDMITKGITAIKGRWSPVEVAGTG